MGAVNIQFMVFGLLFLCSVMASMHRQPFGPRVCGRLCLRLGDCRNYTYMSSTLYCQVTNVNDYLKSGDYLFNLTQKNKCTENAELVNTRNKGQQCISLSKSQTATLSPGDKTRLVVVPFAKQSSNLKPNERIKDYQPYQFSLVDQSLTPYPLMDGTEILDLLYVPKQKKILLSRGIPWKRIESYRLDSNTNEVVAKGIRAKSIGADDDRELLFVLTTSKHLIQMTLKGKSRKSLKVFTRATNPTGMVVDSIHKLLYIPIYYRLTSISYDRKVRNRDIVKGAFMYALTLDVKGNNLYYNDNNNIYKVSTDGKRKSKVTSLKYRVFSALYYSEKLYVTLMYADVLDLYIVDMKDKPEVSSVKLGFKSVPGLKMCAIP